MKAEIIAVGTELLLGQIINTNATDVSQFLANVGLDVYYQTVVGDNEKRLLSVLEDAENRSDLIVVCGGLGPTDDDLTKQTVAKHVKRPLLYDSDALKHVEQFFSQSAKPMTDNNKRQALTIKGSTTIQNKAGLACGCLYQQESTYYLLLPGPPTELRDMLRHGVRPLIDELVPEQHQLMSRYLRFMGIGESRLVTELSDLLENQTNPTLAPYAKSNEVMLRLTANADTKDEGTELLDTLEQIIQERVGEYFYGYGEYTSIEQVVVDKLKEHKQTVTFVEGITGGACFERITSIPSSSDVCPGGFVTYTKESKNKLLDLSMEELTENGVISTECVIKMAEKGRLLMGTDYGVSVVGVAGPKQVETKPVGTIVMAVATKNGTVTQELMINRERDYIRDGAVKHSLNLLRKQIK